MDQSIRLMTDAERELHIKDCGDLMQAAMVRYEESNNFHDRADADSWRILMERAIKARSPEQVALMEQERGICNA
jgi:hypothetical protein